MNIEKFSSGNEKLSIKEINFLKNFKEYKNFIENLDIRELSILKSNLISQVEKYIKRNNVKESSKKYISSLTSKIIKELDIIIENKKRLEELEELEKEFPSIKNIKELKNLVEQNLIRYEDVQKWIKKGWKSVRIHYKNGKTDKINIDDLKNFFENIKNAQNYSIKSAQEGIKKSNDGKNINYQAISNYAQNKILENKEISANLTKLIAQAQYFMGAKEKGYDTLSKELQERMKIFGLDIKNNPSHNWCAAFVGDCLIRAGYFKDIKELKNSLPAPYPDVASNYLGLGYFKAHIGIYTGGETMINGNSNNMVRYSKVKWHNLVGWVMPKDIGDSNKVHFYQKEKIEPPVGALLVFKRGKGFLPKKIAQKAGLSQYA